MRAFAAAATLSLSILACAETGPYGYTGREPDASGLIYARARYLDPALGRFTQRDAIGLGGGLDDYGYTSGNPANATDPTGNTPDLGPSGNTGGLLGWLFPNYMRNLLSGDLPRPPGMEDQPILTGLGPPNWRGGLLGRLCPTCLDLLLGDPKFADYAMGVTPAPLGGVVPFNRPIAYLSQSRSRELEILQQGLRNPNLLSSFAKDFEDVFERRIPTPYELRGEYALAWGHRGAALSAAKDIFGGQGPNQVSTFVIDTVGSGAFRYHNTLARSIVLTEQEVEEVIGFMQDYISYRHEIRIPGPVSQNRVIGVFHWNTLTPPTSLDPATLIPNPYLRR